MHERMHMYCRRVISMACGKLSTSDLSKVRNEILSAAAKWYDIGLELGMTADYLDTIRKTNDDPQDCLRKLLRRWLSCVDPQPSWKALINALSSPAVNYQALASKIEEKYRNADPDINADISDNEGVLPNQFVPPKSTPKPKPKPRRRRNTFVPADHDKWIRKRELVQLFRDISSHEVSLDQIEKARQCIKHGGTCSERYQFLEFEKVLDENQVSLSSYN